MEWNIKRYIVTNELLTDIHFEFSIFVFDGLCEQHEMIEDSGSSAIGDLWRAFLCS